ncbi:hypothetical protein D3C84_453800 [compost metagenome]
MDGQQVHFLDACRDFGGDADLHVLGQQQGSHAATVAASQGYHHHFAVVGSLDRLDHVGRVAAGGNCQKYIARLAECADLLGKDFVVAVVVGDGRDGRAVGGQCHGGQARALALEAVEQFRGKVLGVAGRAAVAAGQDLALIEQRVDHHHAAVLDVRGQQFHGLQLGVDAGLEELADTGLHVHRVRPSVGRRSGVEGVLQPGQSRGRITVHCFDGNHIKSTRVFCPAGFLLEELLGGVSQFFALAGIDALEGAAPAGMTPIADFGEYYCIAVEHDQIELAAPA